MPPFSLSNQSSLLSASGMGGGASMNARQLLLPSTVGAAALRKRQEEQEVMEHLPDEKDIAEYAKEQEDETSLLQDILEFPSKVAGFFAVTGALEGLVEGDLEQAAEGFARGGPWAFLSDFLGITDDFAERKTFRDVRIAAGARDVDEGVGNIILNILGDIALDPISWVNPFGVASKAQRHAASLVNPTRRIRRDDLRKLIVSGDKAWAAEEVLLVAQRRQEELAKAVGKGDIVHDMRFIDPKNPVFGPRSPAELLDEEKMIAEITPGLIFDAEKGFARQAVSLEEKLKSGITAMATFKIPIFGEHHKLFGANPDGIGLHVARALDNTAEALRKIPLVKQILTTFNPSQIPGLSAYGRATLKEATKIRQEIQNAIIVEGHDQVQRLIKGPLGEVVEHMGREDRRNVNRVLFDLVELQAADMKTAGIRETFGELYSFSRNQTRAKLARQDPKLASLIVKADEGDEDAMRLLFDQGVPLRDSQLRKIGEKGREGLELPEPTPAVSETLTEQAGRPDIEVADQLPETERVLTKEKIITREEVLEQARKERLERLDTVQGMIDSGKFTWDDLKNHAKGLGKILEDLHSIEEKVGITDGGLMGYLSRIVSPSARQVINEVMPQRLKAMGDDAWHIGQAFLQGRVFSDLNVNEVNLMMHLIGSRATGGNPLEAVHKIFWGDKAVARKLKREAPEVLEYITTETSAAVMKRIESSGKVRGKKAMMDVLFNPEAGLVLEITDSRDLATTLRNGLVGQEMHALVPFVRHSGGGGAKSPNPVEIMDDGVNAQAKARTNYARRLIDNEVESRLAATKGDYDTVLDELKEQLHYDPATQGSSVGAASSLPAPVQRKMNAHRVIVNKQEDIAKLRNVRPRGGSKAGNRVRARVSKTKGGVPKVSFENVGFLPADMKKKLLQDTRDQVTRIKHLKFTPDEEFRILEARSKKSAAKVKQKRLTPEERQKVLSAALNKEKERRYKQLAKRFNADIDDEIKFRIEDDLQVLAEAKSNMAEVQSHLSEKIKSVTAKKKEKMGTLRARRKDARHEVRKAAELTARGQSQERSIAAAQAHEWGAKAFNDPAELMKELKDQPGQKVYWMDRDAARGVVDFMDAFSKPDTWKQTFAIFDHFTHWWKRTTVLPFPASRMRDIISNISLLMMGGFRHPSSFSDAWSMSHTYRKWVKGKIDDIDKHLEGKTVTISLADGAKKQVPQAEILREVRRNGGLDGGYLRDEFQDIALEYAGDLSQKRGLARRAAHTRVGEWLDIPVLFGETPTSPLTKGGMGFSVWGDNFTKLAGVIDGMKRGMGLTEATDHVKRFLWSPGSTHLSSTERHLFRRIIPFYNWTRFVTGLTVDQYFKNPRVFTPFAKARDNLERDIGTSDLPIDMLAGRRVAERLGVPVKMGKDGPRYLLFDGYLPHAEIGNLAQAVMGLIPGSGVSGKESLTFLGEKLNPLIKEPLESALNFNLHFQKDVEFFPGEHADFMGLTVGKKSLKTIHNIRFLKTINDLNVFNLADFRIGAGDAVERTPPGREPRHFGTQVAQFLGQPKQQSISIEAETRRQFITKKIEASKIKGAVRRRVGDPRAFKKDDIPVLAELYGHRQAELLRLQKVGAKFGFDVQKRRG